MPNMLRMYEGQPPTSETTLYTAPAAAVGPNPRNVREIIAVNTTAVAAVFSLSIVPSGGTAGATNRIFSNQSIAPNSEQTFEIDEVLNAGDFISGLQTTASALTLTINGN